ncbi:MAG: PTS fructose transporter subunit IIA [Bacilli bacterium]
MKTKKIHYIIASHGQLSQGYTNTINLLTQNNNVNAITAYLDDVFPDNLIKLMETFQSKDDVIIFTDISCGSVTQKVLELYGNKPNVYIFSGINLPMILEIILHGETPTSEYCDKLLQSAREQITCLHNFTKTRD